MPAQGEEFIERCKQHVISTLSTLPECAPTGQGRQLRVWKFRKRIGRTFASFEVVQISSDA